MINYLIAFSNTISIVAIIAAFVTLSRAVKISKKLTQIVEEQRRIDAATEAAEDVVKFRADQRRLMDADD